MSGTVTVLAASGRQATATVRALLSAGRPVRAVMRDPSRDDARALSRAGADVLAGSLDDEPSIDAALNGVDGVFVALPLYISPTVTPGLGPDDEVRRGRAVIEAAQRAEIRHVVYSSALGVDAPAPNPLMLPKVELERVLRASGVPSTILRPVGFMENQLGPARGLRPDGVLVSTSPPHVPEQLIAIDDIGQIAAAAFGAPDLWVGRELAVAGDELPVPMIAEELGRVSGRAVRYERASLDAIRALDPARAAALDRMYAADRPTADVRACRAAIPGLRRFREWTQTPQIAMTLRAYLSEAPTISLATNAATTDVPG